MCFMCWSLVWASPRACGFLRILPFHSTVTFSRAAFAAVFFFFIAIPFDCRRFYPTPLSLPRPVAETGVSSP